MLNVYLAGLKKGSGKTLIAAGLAGTMQSLGYSVSYTKPIQTGTDLLNDDIDVIKKIDSNIKTVTTYKFQSSNSPLVGAYEENINNIDSAKIMQDYKTNAQMTECRIVEGANSISSPLNEKMTEADLIYKFNLPVILVINPIISNIDDIITGVNFIHYSHINLMGIILNDYDINSKDLEQKYLHALIKQYTKCTVLGSFKHYDNIENLPADELISDTLHNLNIENIFGLKIAKLD